MSLIKTGLGFDIHPFAPERRLILGGVEIPGHPGLAGHSDADVLCHAVTDALLGAAADGDIGTHFPDSDLRWKNADSLELLAVTGRRLTKRGMSILHIDCVVLAEQPKILSYRLKMREQLAGALDLPLDSVSVKATTMEKLGPIGRGEGIAVMAVATISFPLETIDKKSG